MFLGSWPASGNRIGTTTWPYNARALSEVPRREKTKGAPQRNAGALSIRALEGSRWHQGAWALRLWVLNVGESVEGGEKGWLVQANPAEPIGSKADMAC